MFEGLRDTRFKFGLNHGDLSVKNVRVDSVDKIYLIDWGSAEANIVPHFDFVEIVQSSLESSSIEFKKFLEGYGMHYREFKKIESEIEKLMLLRALDKLRWSLERKPGKVKHFITNTQKILQRKII